MPNASDVSGLFSGGSSTGVALGTVFNGSDGPIPGTNATTLPATGLFAAAYQNTLMGQARNDDTHALSLSPLFLSFVSRFLFPRVPPQISWLAGWLETSKSSSALTGPLLGGPVLGDLSRRLASATAATTASPSPSFPYPRLVILSAHYNTQLGVLSALGLDAAGALPASSAVSIPWITVPSIPTVGVIPAAAAVLAFELHRSGATSGPTNGPTNATTASTNSSQTLFAVRAVLQNGPGKGVTPVPLPCASPGAALLAGSGACSLEDFNALIAAPVASAGSPSSWCAACGATTPLACRAAAAAAGGAGATSSGAGRGAAAGAAAAAAAAVAVSALAVGVF